MQTLSLKTNQDGEELTKMPVFHLYRFLFKKINHSEDALGMHDFFST